MERHQKELEDLFAKLNSKMNKSIQAPSVPKSPLSSKDSLKLVKIDKGQAVHPGNLRHSKVSVLQESSNGLMTESDEIRNIVKEKVLTKSKSNELRVIKEASNIDDDNIEEKGNRLVHKLREGIKETKEGQFIIHSQHEKSSNDNNSITSKEKSTHPIINKVFNLESKYENYNSQQLAYQAYKNLSHCHSNAPKFLERMKFYSIKHQTKSELIDLLVQKAKPKMKEETRVGTFNRLIQDSNRRAEAKNRVELLSTNNQIANDFYETEANLIKETPKKFSQNKWDKVMQRFKENEKKKKEKRKQKYEAQRKEEKEREQREVDEMKKYNKKTSRQNIESISQRLYKQALNKRLRSEGNSQWNSTSNLRIDTELSIRKFSHPKKNINYHKKNNISNEVMKTEMNHQGVYYPKQNNPKRKMMNERYNYTQKSALVKKPKEYVPYVNAEKIVKGFFKQSCLKTYYH